MSKRSEERSLFTISSTAQLVTLIFMSSENRKKKILLDIHSLCCFLICVAEVWESLTDFTQDRKFHQKDWKVNKEWGSKKEF